MNGETGSSEVYHEAHFHSLYPFKNICFEALFTNTYTLIFLFLSHITSAIHGSWTPVGTKSKYVV